MATDPRSPPRGDDLSPLDAYRSPLATGPPRWSSAPDLGSVVPWGLLDVIVVAVLYVGASVFVGKIVARLLSVPAVDSAELPPDQWMSLILSGSVGSLAGLALSIAWLRLAGRATWADLGWRFGLLVPHALLGLVGFLVLMLPVFGLQAVLNFLYEQAFGPPPQHPLIEHLRDHPGGSAFLIAGFMAVVVAPVTEEFLFRGVLQGWLQRVAVGWTQFSLPLPPDEGHAERASMPQQAARPLLVWPIVVSALVFALMHYSHGVAWIPLFFFALGLGYLYQRTGSLVAPIVLHMSLNASTMLILWLSST